MHIDYKHHSPSSLNLFAAQPAMWVLEKCLGLKQPVGVPAHRGSAVESGVAYGLMHPDADPKACFKEALAKYDSLTGLSGDERREKYRANIPDMVAQAIIELRPYGMPTEVQGHITQQVDGLRLPIIGYFDFMWGKEGIIVDLKTTERLPSEIKIPHARQVSFYCGDNVEGRLTYVTPKKCATYGLENIRAHKEALVQLAKNVEYFLSKGKEPEDYVRMTAPDLESFYWGDPVARELAWQYWKNLAMTRTLEYVADRLQHVERVATETEKLACVTRELKHKTRTFARLADAGKMPRYRQRFELELWYAIVEDYRIRAASEKLP